MISPLFVGTFIFFTLLAAVFVFWPLVKNVKYRHSRFIGATLMATLGVAIFSLLMYMSLGATPDLAIYDQLRALNTTENEQERVALMAELSEAVQARVEEKPKNAENLFLLSSLQLQQQDYAGAISSLKKLNTLSPGSDRIHAEIAQAIFLRNKSKFDAEVGLYAGKALKINPDNAMALSMFGMRAYDEGAYDTAMVAWGRAQQQLAAGSTTYRSFAQGVANAKLAKRSANEQSMQVGAQRVREAFGLPLTFLSEKPVPSSKPLSQKPAAGFDINLTIAEELRSQAADYILFVFARAAEGPKMPLAIQKFQLVQAPTEIRLDNASAMMPQMNLSSQTSVDVVVRATKKGQVTAEPGDYELVAESISWRELKAPLSLSLKEENRVD